jgi:IMP dehydrogenase/GMP reductase
MKDIKFDFNDILIVPTALTDISSRTEVNPYLSNGFLPLITAPMDTVVDGTNCEIFYYNNVNVCLPRFEKRTRTDMFQSYSLVQFEEKYLKYVLEGTHYVLIDTANGHIKTLVDATKKAKDMYGENMVLMVGNIANPATYRIFSEAGADMVRCGIGAGNACTTASNVAISYPMASLINECYHISLTLDTPAKIVADGGMKGYADIIKALALGANIVMLGSIFNKAVESCGQNYLENKNGNPIEISQKEAIEHFSNNDFGDAKIIKKFRGMSTKEVQKKWGNEVLKTSEGVVRYREVEYTLHGWLDNFESYLRSAMSYVGARTLEEFVDKSEIINITNNAYLRFAK